jgi:hypothetical protein
MELDLSPRVLLLQPGPPSDSLAVGSTRSVGAHDMAHIHEKIDLPATSSFTVGGCAGTIGGSTAAAAGGHIELDRPEQAAHREAVEESGFDTNCSGPAADHRTGHARAHCPRFLDIHRITETHEIMD